MDDGDSTCSRLLRSDERLGITCVVMMKEEWSMTDEEGGVHD